MRPDFPARDGQSLHVFIVSAEHPRRCYGALDQLVPDLNYGDQVTVLSGVDSAELGELRDFGSQVTVLHFPGDSVWHLRARLPPMAGSVEWVLVLEDHNVPLPGWRARFQRFWRNRPLMYRPYLARQAT